jgi:hypothetical protein
MNEDQVKDEKGRENEPATDSRQPGERVYAPASARIAKPPAPGHEALVRHVDESTPERQAAPEATEQSEERTD